MKSIIVLCPDRFDILADILERSGCLVGFTHFKLITVLYILFAVLWIGIVVIPIRIRISIFDADPDPDPDTY